ncbi:AAA domain-containing protein [Phytohabitans sp. ZYX-F-186]|uniref:AAA domain-containing protein n=1 Tax=Phytohabitans maris TaxID=3071409 RepID=A0ABU0ZLD8_9ACTN|nr:AAA domain-containing protein [Phytohabitans sp. ZYX-F-186]MDQ7907849.1 AAA domain-containing protein [Phytohabitans sp. ZYX-F-186]
MTALGDTEQTAGGDSPPAVHARAVALTEYLLAVRALLEKPVRAVPAADAFWQDDLPAHVECGVGPFKPGGSWLRVGRPDPPDPPSIPTPLLRHLVWDLSTVSPPTIGEVAPEVETAFTEWRDGQWEPWAREHQLAEVTRRLHDRLYDLRYRVDIDAARVELVWGHLVLRHRDIHYPLLATPVAIEYDPDSTTVSVTPQGPPRIQVDALGDLDGRRVADLLDLGGTGGQVDIDPWDAAERLDFARRATRRLGLEPDTVVDTGVLFVRPRQRMVRRFLEALRERLTGGSLEVGALAGVLAHEPSRLRMPDDDAEAWDRTSERLLMPMATNDAQESIARRLAAHRNVAVQGPPGTGKTHTIRNLICHLVAHGKRVLVLAQKEDPLRVLRDGLPEEIQPLCLAVLGRSADQLVQLQVAARELADRAATLDSEAEAAWVRQLVAEVAAAEEGFAAARAELLAAAEREARRYDGRSAGEVGEWLRRHEADALVPDPIPPGTPPPLEAAEFAVLADLARRLTAADRAAALGPLPADGQLPTGEAVAARRDALRDARKVVDALRDRGMAIAGVREHGPTVVDELAAALRGAADELTRREGSWTDRLGQLIRDPSWRAVWDGHVAACQQLLGELGQRTAFVAGRRVTIPEPYSTQPRRLLSQLSEIRARYAAGKAVRRLTHAELARLVSEVQVDGEPLRTTDDVDLVVATVEREQLRQQLAARWDEWRTRLDVPVPTSTVDAAAPPSSRGVSPGGRGVSPGGPGASLDARGASPDGRGVSPGGRGVSPGGRGVSPGGRGGEPELWAGRLLSSAVSALEWESHRWPELHATLVTVFPRCPRDVDARQIAELAGAVEAAGNVLLADRLEAERAAMAEWLHRFAPESPQIQALAAAWDRDDLAGWDAALAEIRRLWTLRPDATRYAALHARLAAVAPQWAAAIDAAATSVGGAGATSPGGTAAAASGGAGAASCGSAGAAGPAASSGGAAAGAAFPGGAGAAPGAASSGGTASAGASGAASFDGAGALRAWQWRQAQTWFDEVVGDVDGADFGRRLERARDQIRRLTGDLVVTSAWLEVALSLDDRRKAALADWTAALRKIGKGTGKSAAHWQAAAQRAMSEAVTAVPVWIMSIDRALEQFPGHAPVFDVVIVDEASQADLFALPVLTLARRAVVVGDDQQIGPQLVGVPTDRVNALVATHLHPAGVPSAEHFDTESSLYDHAVRRSPQRILLTEHFRSVPEIIGFSSAVYYDGKIQPLRAARSGLDRSVVAEHVPDGKRVTLPEYGEVNIAEAEALVARVAAIVADPTYTGHTLGVVSLLSGSGQAAYLQHRLREEIGPEELERRELRVGDPYTFQGDERDVVLASMVVSSADAAIGAFTKRDFHRRINVAASRARDQMWLFHSVTLADLHPDDARAALLAYAQRPPAPPEVGGEPATEFQRAVHRRLVAAGLRAVPQFRIGTFKVDFMVAAPDGRRLAIECDGDTYHGAEAFAHDLRRQAILERVGNCVFVRLRASVFHRDPEAAMRPVWDRAGELGLVLTKGAAGSLGAGRP